MPVAMCDRSPDCVSIKLLGAEVDWICLKKFDGKAADTQKSQKE